MFWDERNQSFNHPLLSWTIPSFMDVGMRLPIKSLGNSRRWKGHEKNIYENSLKPWDFQGFPSIFLPFSTGESHLQLVPIQGYWHRSLNPKKLIEVGFSHLGARMTMARTIKLYKVGPGKDGKGIMLNWWLFFGGLEANHIHIQVEYMCKFYLLVFLYAFIHYYSFMYSCMVMYIQQTADSSIMFVNSAAQSARLTKP